MEILITQQYFMHVTPEWYDPQILSGEGTIEEQICEFEKSRVEKDNLYVADLRRGTTTVTVAPDLPVAWCGDTDNHSRHKYSAKNGRFLCTGKSIMDAEEINSILVEETGLAEIALEAVKKDADD